LENTKNTLSYKVYDRPGKKMSQDELQKLYCELLDVAKTCLDEIPDYQCLSGRKEEFDRLIISVVRNESGKLLGFCSSYILDGGELGNIFHLGLTCVRPEGRGLKFTHTLTSKVVQHFLFKYSLFKPSWVTNVACVLSSLGNVSMYFDDVYPSPAVKSPCSEQMKVATLINLKYRNELYVSSKANFNKETFVFEESVLGNMFQKEAFDKRYLHRNNDLNDYFRNLMNFERGDEVLQVGKVSLLTFPSYFFRKIKMRFFSSFPKFISLPSN